jgi:hypothetical protein
VNFAIAWTSQQPRQDADDPDRFPESPQPERARGGASEGGCAANLTAARMATYRAEDAILRTISPPARAATQERSGLPQYRYEAVTPIVRGRYVV